MATRAEKFKSADQRRAARPPSKRTKSAAPGLAVDTSLPKSSATLRRKGGSSTGARNRSDHAQRKASFALEDTAAPLRPSRKSTRSSQNRIKPESNLTRRQVRRVHAPKARAERAQARMR